MEYREITLDETTLPQLLALSAAWEQELSCYGYHRNGPEEYEGKRIFAAVEDGRMIGYLMGHFTTVDYQAFNAAMPKGTRRFVMDEFYVNSAYRSRGVGGALFRFAEEAVRGEADYLDLGTATKDYKAILNFYMNRMGMEFWSARLYKKL